jgi:hypothetical protein
VTSRTAIVALPVSRAEAFAYLADVENLPGWATEFARELKVVDGRHKVVNGLGEFFFEIRAHEETGVIDMYAGPTEDALALFPTRVVALGERQSAFVFTMFQQPGQPDDQFEGQYESLQRELAIVARRFGG